MGSTKLFFIRLLGEIPQKACTLVACFKRKARSYYTDIFKTELHISSNKIFKFPVSSASYLSI